MNKREMRELYPELPDAEFDGLWDQVQALPTRTEEIAHGVLDGMIGSFRDPAYRVQFFAGVLATVPCSRARLGFLPSFLIAMAAGYAAKWAYGSVEEIKSKLDGSRATPRLFCDFKACPGCEPGAACEGASDAAGGV